MARVVTEIHPGVCGFICRVTAASEDEQNVHLSVRSECEKIQGLAAALPEVDAYQEIQQGHEGRIHQSVRTHLNGCCSGCVVPSGMFKSMQVAAGLALPVGCSIALNRE